MNAIDHVHEAIKFIDRHIPNSIDLAEVSHAAGYSLAHFHGVFFKVTGQSLAAFIRRRRLAYAARQLTFSVEGILGIAIQCGYSSQEAFTRAFSKEYGMTPKAFRKNPAHGEIYRRLGLERSQSMLKGNQRFYTRESVVNNLKSSSNMKNLSGVRQITFYNGTHWAPEDIPFTSSMSSVMDYLGANYPVRQLGAHGQEWNQHMGNVYFLDWSGIAFGMLWQKGWHIQCTDFMYADDPEKVLDRSFRAAGRRYHRVCKVDADQQHLKDEMVASIDRGVPVLAYGVVGPPDCCIITGYADGGDTVMGWSFFTTMPTPPDDLKGVIELPSGQFMRGNWQEKTYSLIIIDEPCDKPDIHILDRESLENAVCIAKRQESQGFICGHLAYDAWRDQVLCDDGLVNVDPDTLRANFDVHNITVGNIAECRCWAGRYLWDMMDRYEGEVKDHLDKAAEHYNAIHDLMWDAWNILGGNGHPEAYIKFADRGNREKIAVVIEKATAHDKEAIEHIRQALKAMDKE